MCIGGLDENGTTITEIDGPGNPDFNDGSDVTCVTICIDIDECANDDVCPQTFTDSDTCENLDGDVVCGCGYGYIMNSTNITTYYNDRKSLFFRLLTNSLPLLLYDLQSRLKVKLMKVLELLKTG